jgi:hypothetical protein
MDPGSPPTAEHASQTGELVLFSRAHGLGLSFADLEASDDARFYTWLWSELREQIRDLVRLVVPR